MTQHKLLLIGSALLGGTACINAEAPPNPFAPPIENGIAGTVLVDGVAEPGNVIITVYDADNPGPPFGTGRPVTFSAVSFLEFTGAGGGIQSADFYVGNLPDGDYIVNALLDMDGNFNPFAVSTGGATCGDYVGTHVQDLDGGQTATVSVSGGELRDDITVVIDTLISVQRPAFHLNDAFAPMNETTGTNPTNPQSYRVDATAVHTVFPPVDNRDDYPDGFPIDLEGPCPADSGDPTRCDAATTDPCDVAFWVIAFDEDDDGFIDPHPNHDPSLGLLHIWPRVFLTYLGTPNEDGSFETGLEEGEFIAGENFPYLIEATFGAYPFPLNTFVPVRQLPVAWAPAVRKFDADRNELDFIDLREPDVEPADFPSGHWSITVVQFTGQTWAIPNETVLLPSTDSDSFTPALQAGTMQTIDG